ncbi:hypothetical protein K8I61_17115 [bacterium]|nr:hypothetical protein [bacterium]
MPRDGTLDRPEDYWRTHLSRERFRDRRGAHAGETIFILGSGPSLLANDLSLLAPHRVLCVNHTIFFADKAEPDFWVFLDSLPEFKAYLPGAIHRGVTCFVNQMCGWEKLPEPVYFNPCDLPGHCMYSTTDAALGLTVHLGFARAFLVGFDGGNGFDGKSGHVFHRHLASNPTSYRWADEAIRRKQAFIEIESAGAFHGLEFLAHRALADAIAAAPAESGVRS